LPASEINAQIQEDPMLFLHGMKWDQALSYAKKMMGDEFPENKISVYLIAISEIKIDMELSETVKSAGDKVIERIVNDL
jgi:hydrogenase maturation protease